MRRLEKKEEMMPCSFRPDLSKSNLSLLQSREELAKNFSLIQGPGHISARKVEVGFKENLIMDVPYMYTINLKDVQLESPDA